MYLSNFLGGGRGWAFKVLGFDIRTRTVPQLGTTTWRSFAVLEFASGRVYRRGGVKIDPLNLFTNIRRGRGSHILCKGIESSWPPPPLQIQPCWWCAFQSSRRSCFSGGCSSVLELYTAAESELLHQSSRSGGNLKLSCSHSHFLLCNGHYETIY